MLIQEKCRRGHNARIHTALTAERSCFSLSLWCTAAKMPVALHMATATSGAQARPAFASSRVQRRSTAPARRTLSVRVRSEQASTSAAAASPADAQKLFEELGLCLEDYRRAPPSVVRFLQPGAMHEPSIDIA